MRTVLATAFVFLLAAGCTGSSPTATPRPSPVTTPTAESYSDPAREIEVAAGESFVIALASNPSIPHKWRLAQPLDSSLLQLTGKQYKPSHPGEKIAGSGGTEYWTFRALAPGSTDIRLEYVESDSLPPAESRTFQVRVR